MRGELERELTAGGRGSGDEGSVATLAPSDLGQVASPR